MTQETKMTNATRFVHALAVALLAASPALAGTIIDDPFTDGGVTDGADPLDTAWSGSATLSVANDATIGSGNAMVVDTTGTFQSALTDFGTITLSEDREKLKLEFEINFTTVQNSNAGFRTGFRDPSSSTGSGTQIDQYDVQWDTGANTDAQIAGGGTGTFGGTAQEFFPQDTNASPLSATDTRFYGSFSVQLTTASRVDLRARMGSRVVDAADTTSVYKTFDQTGFQIGSVANNDFNIDNFKVTRWINRIDDTFDVGATPSRNDDGDDPNDTEWYRITTSATGTVLSVAGDDAAGEIGSNDAMLVDNSSSFRRIVTHFESVALEKSGDTIEVGFDVRVPTLPAATGGAFRFGLFNSKGTLFTADGQGTPDDDDEGYHIQVGVGTGNSLLVQEFDGADDVFLGGSTPNQTVATGSFNIADTLPQYMVMRLTRTADGLRMEYFVDGQLVASGVDTSSPFYTFDELAIGTGNANFDYYLDNVVVDVMFVPTPAALPAGLAAMGLALARRRRNR